MLVQTHSQQFSLTIFVMWCVCLQHIRSNEKLLRQLCLERFGLRPYSCTILLSYYYVWLILSYRYDVVLACWEANPDNRPAFSELVCTISTLLERIAGYMPIKKFSCKSSVQDAFFEEPDWTDKAERKLGEEEFVVEEKETPCWLPMLILCC